MIDMEDLYVVCRVITGGLVSCDLLDVEEERSLRNLVNTAEAAYHFMFLFEILCPVIAFSTLAYLTWCLVDREEGEVYLTVTHSSLVQLFCKCTIESMGRR